MGCLPEMLGVSLLNQKFNQSTQFMSGFTALPSFFQIPLELTGTEQALYPQVLKQGFG
jgi:hypothetical protein